MARVNGLFNIQGKLGNVSFYTIKGGETVYVRTKGGPTARRIKVGKEFEKLRKHQAEWRGCVLFSRQLINGVYGLHKLGDFNVSAAWNGLAKKLMSTDKEHPVGERSVLLSQNKTVLEGYNMNRRFPFNSVFRTPVSVEIDYSALTAKISVSRIVTANDLYNVQKLPYFRLYFSFGFISDLVYNTDDYKYNYSPEIIVNEYRTTEMYSKKISTDWFVANDIIGESVYELKLHDELGAIALERTTAIVGAGIEFGNIVAGRAIEAVKNACCAKIIKVM